MSVKDKYTYPEGFFHWLKKNHNVYNAFAMQASRMARTGRPRYSARTIVEVMRWNTEIADSTKTFKIQNNMIPGMARLWMATFGEDYPKFFEIKVVKRLNVRCCCEPGKVLGTIVDAGHDIKMVLKEPVSAAFAPEVGSATRLRYIRLQRRPFMGYPYGPIEYAYDSGHQDVETLILNLPGFAAGDRVNGVD